MARLWGALVAADAWLADELEREVFAPAGRLYALLAVMWWGWPLMLTAVGR